MTAQPDGFRGWSGAVYGAALVLMFSCATIYHWLPDDRPRSFMRILDHCAIFVLIAGYLHAFHPSERVSSVGLDHPSPDVGHGWSGNHLQVSMDRAKRSRLGLSLPGDGMVSRSRSFNRLPAAVPGTVLRLIVAGGVLYSIGAFVYIWKGMPFRLAIWHSFVIAGSLVHYFAVTNYLRA
jgi:hemolysin III